MDKEKILEMSRRENKNTDLVRKETEVRAADIAGGAAILLCIIFRAVEQAFFDRPCFGYYCIFTSYLAASFIYRAVKLKERKYKVFAVVWSFAALLSLAMYIVQLAKESGALP